MQPTPSLGPNVPIRTLGGIESWKKLGYKTRQALQRPKRTQYPNGKIKWEAYRSLRRDYRKAKLHKRPNQCSGLGEGFNRATLR